MDKNKMLPKEIRDKIDKYCGDIKSFCYTNSNTDKEFDRLVDTVYHRIEGIHDLCSSLR